MCTSRHLSLTTLRAVLLAFAVLLLCVPRVVARLALLSPLMVVPLLLPGRLAMFLQAAAVPHWVVATAVAVAVLLLLVGCLAMPLLLVRLALRLLRLRRRRRRRRLRRRVLRLILTSLMTGAAAVVVGLVRLVVMVATAAAAVVVALARRAVVATRLLMTRTLVTMSRIRCRSMTLMLRLLAFLISVWCRLRRGMSFFLLMLLASSLLSGASSRTGRLAASPPRSAVCCPTAPLSFRRLLSRRLRLIARGGLCFSTSCLAFSPPRLSFAALALAVPSGAPLGDVSPPLPAATPPRHPTLSSARDASLLSPGVGLGSWSSRPLLAASSTSATIASSLMR